MNKEMNTQLKVERKRLLTELCYELLNSANSFTLHEERALHRKTVLYYSTICKYREKVAYYRNSVDSLRKRLRKLRISYLIKDYKNQ